MLESPPSQSDIASIAASINRRGSAAIVEELKSTMTATLPRSSLAEFETDADGSLLLACRGVGFKNLSQRVT